MPYVSIIIPVYNVEKYLCQCVDSILLQKLDNIEIILIDDGSTDSSPKICDEYAKQDARIKVLHKRNGGLSEARNTGIDLAQGEYLMFLDSDDWWNPNVLVKDILSYVKTRSDIEMFLFSSLDYIEGKGIFKRKEHERLSQILTKSKEEYYQSLLDNGNLEVHAGTKILKTAFIKSNYLYFKKGIKGEDNEWMIRLLRVLSNVDIINEYIYIYRANRIGSITNTIGYTNITDLLDIVKNCLEYYNDQNNPHKHLKDKELCFCSYLWFTALGLLYLLRKEDKKKIIKEFKLTAKVCKYSQSKKTRACYCLYRIVGLTLTSFILGKYIQVKRKKPINKIKVSD